MIEVKRAYEAPSKKDGARFLVDRLWPRGVTKESLQIDAWLKDVSPSNELRKRFHGHPEEWQEFCLHYFAELSKVPDAWGPIIAALKKGTVTLIYGARDTEHNNAIALREYLLRHEPKSKVK
jgi:uncharacterized protein YeaO (DUF488 family)